MVGAIEDEARGVGDVDVVDAEGGPARHPGHDEPALGRPPHEATLGAADTVLFGRKTYDSFAGAWPGREAAGGEDAPFAKALGDARKIVASSQKLEFAWRNSEQLEGDLVESVTALKNEPGGNIALSGTSLSALAQELSGNDAYYAEPANAPGTAGYTGKASAAGRAGGRIPRWLRSWPGASSASCAR